MGLRWKQKSLLWTPGETQKHGERQRGATLANAGLPPKAAESIVDKATSLLARLPSSDSPMLLVEGGGRGRRLALADRRKETCCVPVHELVGLGYRRLGGRCQPHQMEQPFGRST